MDNIKTIKEAIQFYKGLSYNDKLRLFQCVCCSKDPNECGCTEENEDEKGFCKKFIRR